MLGSYTRLIHGDLHQGNVLLVAGYDSVRLLSAAAHGSLEAYMIMAALFNLAFQATLREHCLSPVNRRNMRQLVEQLCRPFVAEQPFLFGGDSLTDDFS